MKNSKVPTADLHNLKKAWDRLTKNVVHFQRNGVVFTEPRRSYNNKTFLTVGPDGKTYRTPTITLRRKTKPAQERELQRRIAKLRARPYLGPFIIFYPDGEVRQRILCKHARKNVVNTPE